MNQQNSTTKFFIVKLLVYYILFLFGNSRLRIYTILNCSLSICDMAIANSLIAVVVIRDIKIGGSISKIETSYGLYLESLTTLAIEHKSYMLPVNLLCFNPHKSSNKPEVRRKTLPEVKPEILIFIHLKGLLL